MSSWQCLEACQKRPPKLNQPTVSGAPTIADDVGRWSAIGCWWVLIREDLLKNDDDRKNYKREKLTKARGRSEVQEDARRKREMAPFGRWLVSAGRIARRRFPSVPALSVMSTVCPTVLLSTCQPSMRRRRGGRCDWLGIGWGPEGTWGGCGGQ